MIFPLHVALILFVAVSWYTAGTGFAALLGDLPATLGYLMSAALQVVLATSALKLIPRDRNDLVQCPIWWSLYLSTAVVSITFSIGLYFSIFSSKEYGDSLFYETYNKTYGQVSALSESLAKLAIRIEDLSATSGQLALTEASGGGGTCLGRGGSGRGPYYYKRIYQKERFNSMWEDFQLVSKRAKKNVESMRMLEKSNDPVDKKLLDLARLYRDFKTDYQGIITSPIRKELTNYAVWEMDGFPANSEYAHFSGKERACRDPLTVAKIKAVLDSFPAEASNVDIPRFSSDDNKTVIELIIKDVFRLFAGGASESMAVLSNERYVLPITVGALVDAVILLIAIAIAMTEGKRKSGSEHPDKLRLLAEVYRSLSQLPTRYPDLNLPKGDGLNPETAAKAAEFLLALLRCLAVKIGSDQYFFLPVEHRGSEQFLSPRSLSYLALVTDVVNALGQHRLLDMRMGPTTEYRGWTLMEAVKSLDLGPTDFGVNGHFYVYPLKARLMASVICSTSDTSDLFSRGSGPFAELLDYLRISNDEGLPPSLVGDRRYYARMVHRRLQRKDGGWELTLFPKSAEVDRLLCAWLRDDDDGMSDLVEELPHALFRPDIRRYNFNERAKKRIEELVITTSGVTEP